MLANNLSLDEEDAVQAELLELQAEQVSTFCMRSEQLIMLFPAQGPKCTIGEGHRASSRRTRNNPRGTCRRADEGGTRCDISLI